MTELPVIKLTGSTGQDTISDCGICTVATLCDKRYEDVVAEAVQIVGENWKNGLYISQIIELARRFGVTLKRKRKYDIEEATGILNCEILHKGTGGRPRWENHVVVLMDGRVYDSDLRVWAIDAFRDHYHATFRTLLELQ